MIHLDAGQLRTPVTVIAVTKTKNANGFTVRCRYDSRITPTCLVRRGGEAWEIISIDNVDERGQWMELTVARMEDAV